MLPPTVSLDDLKGKALETAYRLDAYSSYGGNVKRAVTALARRNSDWPREDIERWLHEAIVVQDSATAWLEINKQRMFDWHREEQQPDIGTVTQSFRDAHAVFPASELDWLLGINFMYFYQK